MLSKKQNVVIALDYDRTLVNDRKEILPKTKEILIELQKQGVILVIASGRPYSGVKHMCHELQMDKYSGMVIGCNGAEIYNVLNDELIYSSFISQERTSELIIKLDKFPFSKGAYDGDTMYVDNYTPDLGDEASSNRLKLVEDKDKLYEIATPKVVLSETRETIHGYYDGVRKVIGDDFNLVRSSPRYLEISDKTIEKGSALLYVLDKLNKEVSNCIAFGDSDNDLDLLKTAGHSVVMGNGSDLVKEIADHITDCNNTEGIYTFLQKHI